MSRPTQTRDWQNEELSNPAAQHCQWMSEEATDGVANGDVVRWPVECERLKFLGFSPWHTACHSKLGSTGPCENIRMVEAMSLVRKNRDLRIDFFRGLALWWIFSDHIPGNVLGDYSLRNFALCDATEVFVLLAGVSAGSAYGAIMDRHGYAYAVVDILRRVWMLFIVHVFVFVVYAALVGYSADILRRSSYLDESHLDVLAGAPYRALLEALFLRYQPSLLNILPLYIVLLLIFSIALPLLRRSKLLLILSMILYFTARATGISPPSSLGTGWFFNPLAWQLLFMIGAILAYTPVRMPELRHVFDLAAVLILLAGLAIIWVVWKDPSVLSFLPESIARRVLWIDKTTLDPMRLISVLSLLWLTLRLVPRGADWLRSRWSAPFVLIGQHSLPVFCVGVVISFGGRLALELNDGALTQLLVNLIGASSLLAVGALAAWFSSFSAGRRRQDATSQPSSEMLRLLSAQQTVGWRNSARSLENTRPRQVERSVHFISELMERKVQLRRL